jgi:hypothetical protein
MLQSQCDFSGGYFAQTATIKRGNYANSVELSLFKSKLFGWDTKLDGEKVFKSSLLAWGCFNLQTC